MSWTQFRPGYHGFHFINNFDNFICKNYDNVGFCGGMCFAALDYAYENKSIPPDIKAPSKGEPLYDYLLDRQIASLTRGGTLNNAWEKMLEWQIKPDTGTESSPVHSIKYEIRNTEWPEIRNRLEKGWPVVLMLIRGYFNRHRRDNPAQNHQILAIGHKIEKMGDERVTIYTYDPNRPNETNTIKFYTTGSGSIKAEDSTGKPLRGFFRVNYNHDKIENVRSKPILCDRVFININK